MSHARNEESCTVDSENKRLVRDDGDARPLSTTARVSSDSPAMARVSPSAGDGEGLAVRQRSRGQRCHSRSPPIPIVLEHVCPTGLLSGGGAETGERHSVETSERRSVQAEESWRQNEQEWQRRRGRRGEGLEVVSLAPPPCVFSPPPCVFSALPPPIGVKWRRCGLRCRRSGVK